MTKLYSTLMELIEQEIVPAVDTGELPPKEAWSRVLEITDRLREAKLIVWDDGYDEVQHNYHHATGFRLAPAFNDDFDDEHDDVVAYEAAIARFWDIVEEVLA